jgi:hypothetical protein
MVTLRNENLETLYENEVQIKNENVSEGVRVLDRSTNRFSISHNIRLSF